MLLVSGLAVLVLVLLHILFPSFDRAARHHIHLWLPLCAGVAIGYVFLFVLPELADFTAEIIETESASGEFWQYRLYLLSLTGLLVYLFIDRLGAPDGRIVHRARLIQGVGFSFYNVLMGYLLSSMPRPGATPVVLATFTLCLHFLGIDHQLRHTHPELFDRQLRWLLALSVCLGWLIGILTDLPQIYSATAIAFVAGSIIVNVMTEELPDRRPASLMAFVVGVLIFATIMAIARSIPRVGH